MDDEATPETLFAFQQEESESETDSQSEKEFITIGSSDEDYYAIESFFSIKPASLLKIHVLPTKYHKPILVIALFDTRTSQTIMNPAVLPKEFWVPHKQYFKAADNQVSSTEWISKHIIIQLFPSCSIKTRVICSKLLGKDLIFGFDIFTKIPKLQDLPNGLKFKQYFQEWGSHPNLFVLNPSIVFPDH